MPVPLKRARVILLSGTVQSIDLLSADSAWCYQGDGPSTAQTPRPGWRFGHRAPRRLRPRKHQGLYEGFSRCRLGRGHTGDTQGEEGAAGGGMCGRWARAGAFATANTRSQENRGPPMTMKRGRAALCSSDAEESKAPLLGRSSRYRSNPRSLPRVYDRRWTGSLERKVE